MRQARSRTTARSCSSSPANEPARARSRPARERGASRRGRRDPPGDLRGRGDWEKLIGPSRSSPRLEADGARRSRCCARRACFAAENLNDLPRAFDAQARALREDPTERRDAHRARGSSPRRRARGTARRHLQRDRRSAQRRAARPRVLDAPRRHRRAPRQDRRGGGRYARARDRRGRFGGARGARRPLPAHRALGRISSASSAGASSSPRRPSEREALYAQMAEVYERSSASPTTRSRRTARCSPRRRPASWRSLRSTGSSRARPCGTSSPRTSRRSCASPETEERADLLMLRLAACASRNEPGRDAIDIYRQVLERDPRTPRPSARWSGSARARARARHRRDPGAALPAVGRLPEAHRRATRCRSGAATIRARRVELLHQIATLYEDAGGDLDSAFDTYARALAEDPASRTTQAGPRSPRARHRPLRRSRQGLRRAGGARSRSPRSRARSSR
jgi:tetratricopeptide (TPR) repeat protein